MKRVFCPKCDNQLAFDETKYPEGKVLAFRNVVLSLRSS